MIDITFPNRTISLRRGTRPSLRSPRRTGRQGWKPVEQRKRRVTTRSRPTRLATSADRGAVRDLGTLS